VGILESETRPRGLAWNLAQAARAEAPAGFPGVAGEWRDRQALARREAARLRAAKRSLRANPGASVEFRLVVARAFGAWKALTRFQAEVKAVVERAPRLARRLVKLSTAQARAQRLLAAAARAGKPGRRYTLELARCESSLAMARHQAPAPELLEQAQELAKGTAWRQLFPQGLGAFVKTKQDPQTREALIQEYRRALRGFPSRGR